MGAARMLRQSLTGGLQVDELTQRLEDLPEDAFFATDTTRE